MRRAHVPFCVEVDLVGRKQNRVCGMGPWPEKAYFFEVLRWTLSPMLGCVLHLVGALGKVDVHP